MADFLSQRRAPARTSPRQRRASRSGWRPRPRAWALAAAVLCSWPAAAHADDLGVLNTLLVLPAALLALIVLVVVLVRGALALGGNVTASDRTKRAWWLVGMGAAALVGFPLFVVLLELWTDRYMRQVTWNPINNATAAIVAFFGLVCIVLGLVVRRPRSE